ncbi:MAG: DUF4923 family protein [Fimbriimonadaceae bacterium]
MVSLAVVFVSLISQTSKLEQFVVGTWQLDPKSVKFSPTTAGKAYMAKHKKGYLEELLRKQAEKDSDVKYTFLSDHSYAVNHKDYRINAKGRLTSRGSWKLRGNDVVVAMTKKAPFTLTFRISKDIKQMHLIQPAGDHGTATIRMARIKAR